MANQTLNYNLQFTADTAQAKQQLQSLQNQLSQLMNSSKYTSGEMPLTKEVADAQQKVVQLKAALESATNVNTGKLDLTKFSNSLKTSKTSLEQYRKSLTSLGPEGQKAFLGLANSIAQAEIPLKRTSALMKDLGITLKNTIKWQLSSTAIHSFMGAIQSAWGYAQDLNESLNNIRIVTGQNIDQMASFAEKANQAAKALSSTTTAYTDAALIYYQQGLEDKQVQERTDTTIKLSNVSRQSVEEVSNQMTAIWNNFYDGTRSLESYADAITALGAATASSSSEIATGIEKFAAVSDTVGLSYEYATAALATVTATTRQSADTVGTAFKTLFARIQDLELGETLEDGTDLGTYSQALETIGVNIKDSNGELKDMDIILEDIGAKWDTLSKDSQVALAQNVAGVRQYTQFMALMDNWDFMQENLETVRQSEGALQEQADTFAESWEAASRQVQTSLQDLYSQLIDDEIVIDVTLGISDAIDGISTFVEKIGGLKSVAIMLSSVLLKLFGNELASSIDNIGFRIQSMLGITEAKAKQTQQTIMQEISKMATQGFTNSSAIQATESAYKGIVEIQQTMLANSERLTAEDKNRFNIEQQILQGQAEQLTIQSQELEQLNQKKATIQETVKEQFQTASEFFNRINTKEKQNIINLNQLELDASSPILNENPTPITEERKKQLQEQNQLLQQQIDAIKNINKLLAESSTSSIKQLSSDYEQAAKNAESYKAIARTLKENSTDSYTKEEANNLKLLLEQYKETLPVSKEFKLAIEELQMAFASGDPTIISSAIDKFTEIGSQAQGTANKLKNGMENLAQTFEATGETAGQKAAQGIRGLKTSIDETVSAEILAATSTSNFQISLKTFIQSVQKAESQTLSFGQKITQLGSAASSLSMFLSGISGLVKTIKDPDVSGWEKFISVLMSVGMIASSLTGTFGAIGKLLTKQTKLNLANAASWLFLGKSIDTVNSELKENAIVSQGGVGGLTRLKNAFSALASGIGVSTAALGVFAAALAVLAGLYAYYKYAEQAGENYIKEQQEINQKKVESAESIKAEIESQTELSNSLDDLYVKYKQSGEGLDELNAKALEAENSFDIQGAALARLTGNYDEYIQKLREARIEENQQSLEELQEGLEAQQKLITQNNESYKTYDWGNGPTSSVGFTFGGWQDKNEEKLIKDFSAVQGEYEYLDLARDSNYQAIGNFMLQVDPNDAEASMKAYEEVLRFFNESTNNGELDFSDNEILKSMQTYLENGKEEYEKAIEMQEEINSLQKQTKALQLETKPEDISTLDDYEKYAEQVENIFTEGIAEDDVESLEAAKKEANEYLKSLTALDKYRTTSEGIKDIEEKYGKKKADAAKDLAEGMDQETLDLFWQIDFSLNEDSWNDQINLAKKKAEQEKIELQIQGVEEVSSKLKETGMTRDDWTEIQNNENIGWGQDGVISFNEFIQKSYQEQVEYLNQLKNKFNETDEEIIKNNIESVQSHSEEIESEVNRQERILERNNKILEENKERYEELKHWQETYQGPLKEEDATFIEQYEKALSNNLDIQASIELNKTKLEDTQAEIENYEGQLLIITKVNDEELQQVLELADSHFAIYADLYGLEDGQTITTELYNEISKTYPLLTQFFTRTTEGTYELNDAFGSFGDTVAQLGVGTEEYRKIIDDYNKSASSYDNLTGYLRENGPASLQKDLLYASANKDNSNIATTDQGTHVYYDAEQAQAMVDALKLLNIEEADHYQNVLDNGEVTTEYLNNLRQLYDENKSGLSQVTDQLGLSKEAAVGAAQAIGNSLENITSFDELQDAIDNGVVQTAEEANVVLNRLRDEITADINPEQWQDMTKYIQENCDSIQGMSKELQKNSKAAKEVAKDMLRYSQSVESITDNYEDWKKMLDKTSSSFKNINKYTRENDKNVAALAEGYADMLDMDVSSLSDDFLQNAENLELYRQAAEGSEDAYNALMAAAQRDIETQLKLDDTDFFDKKAAVQSAMDEINFQNIEVGADLMGYEDFIAKCQDMVNAAGMTAQQAMDYLGSMGIDAEVVESTDQAVDTKESEGVDITPQEVDLPYSVPNFTPTSDGGYQQGTPFTGSGKMTGYYTSPHVEQEQTTNEQTSFALKVTSATKSSGGSLKRTTTGSTKPASSGSGGGGGGGGGGSSKPAKKVQKTKFTDLGDRYHTITKQLEDQSRAVEKLSKLEDRLYGAAKIKAMEKQSKELKKQIELNKQKAEEAKKYLEEDTTELNASVADFNAQFGTNLTVQFDDEGNITNYREIVEEMQRVTNEWEDHLNSLATQEEQDSDENQEYQEKLDNATTRITDAIAQYEETDQVLEDIEDEMEDLNDQIHQLNFDAWAEKLELVVDKFDRYTTLLEHTNKLLGISGDNIYTAAQALTQQVGTLNADGSFSGGVYGQALDTIKELVGETAFEAFQGGATNVFEIAKQDANSAVGELYQKYQNGDIDQAQWVEGLQQLQEQFYSLGDTIVEIDEYAFTAYREALEDGKERLERYTKVIDQAASQLDHMNNLLDLIGQQNDYEKKGVILEGQKEVSKANLDAKTSIYDMAKAQWEEVKANWDAMDDQQKEKYKDTYDAALDYYVEASDEWYSAQEDFAEKTKALAENELALAEKLARESILGEGVSWDAVSDQLDRYSSIGDEYLTKTNQIYEVTKLTRTIQSDIDKTSNTAAKKRLETFKKQTEELAKQEELTEYEMELQNKKYELLLAEIAMEEAQNAKSQVRLTRDSEGNYSYTYTTDEEEMQKAEDEYLQKQNDLYNFLLEGTNDYYTKYVETMREATETFSAINEAYLNGEIETEEEYHRQMLEAQQYYNNLMQTYKNLYNVAMDELGDQAVDSWTTDSGLIIDTTIQLNEDVGTEIDGIIDHGTRLDQSYNDFAKQYISYITNEKEELSGFTTFTETEHGKQQGYWNATQTAINEYYQEIDENIPIASKDIGDLRKEVEDVGNEAKNQAKNIDTLTTSIKDQLTEVDKIVTAWDQYADAVEKVREALAALQIDINGGIDAEGGNPEWGPGDGTEEPGDGNPTGGVNPPSGGGGISGSGKYGDYVTVTGNSPNRYFITSSGEKYHLTGTSYNGYSGSDPEAAEIQKAWDSYVSKNGYSKSMDWNTNKLDLKVIGLESGGYTGEWDDGSGRLALLHSKELVLNKEDTVNLLSSVELIRDLIKVIDLNALATAMNSISALSSNNCAPEQREQEHEKLEQDIHIEANFPNATDKEEILGAFRSLSDLASQYAHRK